MGHDREEYGAIGSDGCPFDRATATTGNPALQPEWRLEFPHLVCLQWDLSSFSP